MVAPINSIKHYVQQTNLVVASGAISNRFIVVGVVAPATASPGEVIQGAIVKAVYVELWLIGNDSTGVLTSFTLTVEKLSGGQPNQTFTNSQNLSAYPNKKNILYTTQGITSTVVDGANAVPVIRAWIKIPKGKQRIGLGDAIFINVAAVGVLRICGVYIYKEYR